VGCGARSPLEDTGASLAPCEDAPRVADCVRLAPQATPLAVIKNDYGPARFTADDDAIYFASERRVYRLPFASGGAVPLTPAPGPNAPDLDRLDVDGDTIVWAMGGQLEAVSTHGGTPRVIAALPFDAGFAILSGAWVITASYTDPFVPAPVYRVPAAGGTPEPILASASRYGATRDDATGHVWLMTTNGLLDVDPASRRVATADGNSSGAAPATAAGRVFFVGFQLPTGGTTSGLGIFEVEPGAPSTELIVGTFQSIAADADDVVFDGEIGVTPGEMRAHASIGVLPLDGSAPLLLAESDTFINSPNTTSFDTDSVRTDGTFVYFADRCTELPGDEWRLVRLCKHP
jgi:hypothetical protein